MAELAQPADNPKQDDSSWKNNIPAWQVTLDGEDLTDRFNPRLISVEIVENRSEKADQLTIILNDSDGKLAMPKKGAVLAVSLGWKQGSEVKAGLVDKGRFRIDEVSHEGPPDVITVKGRSANLTAAYRARKDKSHIGKTIGAIIAEVAKANGLKPRCHASLASIHIEAVEQAAKSDMAFVRDLGRRYDAVATEKAGSLIFAPIGAGTTATGKTLPSFTLTRKAGDRHSFREQDRGSNYDGVEATWHDRKSAKRKTVKVGNKAKSTKTGDKPETKAKRLKKTYASETDAKAAAKAEAGRIKRGAYEFTYDLALGDPAISPECGVTVSGFKSTIDAQKWLVAEATHKMDGSGGLTSSLRLESR